MEWKTDSAVSSFVQELGATLRHVRTWRNVEVKHQKDTVRILLRDTPAKCISEIGELYFLLLRYCNGHSPVLSFESGIWPAESPEARQAINKMQLNPMLA